jgi:hypothetical protein
MIDDRTRDLRQSQARKRRPGCATSATDLQLRDSTTMSLSKHLPQCRRRQLQPQRSGGSSNLVLQTCSTWVTSVAIAALMDLLGSHCCGGSSVGKVTLQAKVGDR